MDCEPSPDYARADASWEYETEGYGHALARIAPGDLPLRLTGDLRLGFEGKRAHAKTTMRDGDERFVALSVRPRTAAVLRGRGRPDGGRRSTGASG